MNRTSEAVNKSAVIQYIEKHHLVITLVWCSIFAGILALNMYFTFLSPEGLDEERLAQLGDFFGGTLNPLLGFITVCLLLFGSFVQTKVLLATQDHLQISSDEYTRKQLEDVLKQSYYDIEQLYASNIKGGFSLGPGGDFKTLKSAHFASTNSKIALNQLLNLPFELLPENLSDRKLELKYLIVRAGSFTHHIASLSHLTALRDYWNFKFKRAVKEAQSYGIVSQEEAETMIDSVTGKNE